MIKSIYEKYKVDLDDQFKRDLLGACIATYGENYRSKFEERINNLEIHSVFSITDLERYIKEHKEEQDFSLELQYIKESKEKIKLIEEEAKEEKIKSQIELFETIKSELQPEDAEKFQQEIEKIEEKGIFFENFTQLDFKFLEMFDKMDLTELKKISQLYNLDVFDKKDADRKDFVIEYFETLKRIDKETQRKINKKYSTYDIVCEECADFDLDKDSFIDEYSIAGSYVTTLSEKDDYTKTKEHIFIDPLKERGGILGTLAHEILHSLENDIIIDEETETMKTVSGFSRKIPEVDTTLFSECIHTIILEKRIFPYLRDLGYDIYDYTDYKIKSLSSNLEFFYKFEEAILASRCGDIDILLDVIGKDNFIRYAELQNNFMDKNSDEKSKILIEKMEEYSRENLGTRIGKATLPYQKDIKGKDIVQKEVKALLEDKTQDRGDFND